MTDEYECENPDCPFWVERDPHQPPPGICPICGEPMRRVSRRLISKRLLDKLREKVRDMAGRG